MGKAFVETTEEGLSAVYPNFMWQGTSDGKGEPLGLVLLGSLAV